MASSTVAQTPAGHSRSRLVAGSKSNSPPSSINPGEPTQFVIGSPLRGTTNPTSMEKLVSDLMTKNSELMKQLDTAKQTILEMGMKGAGLEKELEMRKQIEEMMIMHAVETAKLEWERLAALTKTTEASQPQTKPPPAPGFEVTEATPASGTAGQQNIAAKADSLPDSWADAAAALGLAKASTAYSSLPPAASSAEGRGGNEDLGEPLRNPHPKEFDKPKQYNGNSEGWISWSDSFKEHLFFQEPRWAQLLTAVEELKSDPVTEKHENVWEK